MNQWIGLILVMGLLSACSHEVAVTYESVPDGATVYEQGIGKLGICPVTVHYNGDDVKVRNGKIYTDKIKVTWVSGTTLMVDPTVIDTNPNGHATYTFTPQQSLTDWSGDDRAGQDRRFAAIYDNSLPAPYVQHVVTLGQRRGFFDRLNTSITCFYYGITENPYAVCD